MSRHTRTSSFGVSRRESHDASSFYERKMYAAGLNVFSDSFLSDDRTASDEVPWKPLDRWVDRVYCRTSERMDDIPDGSIALAFTSPPYNAGKEYDQDLDLTEYLRLIGRVGREVYRTLMPGGRYVVNIANLGRKPYIPMHAYFYGLHMELGFLPAGEIIWKKGRGMNANCAWGSWMSAKSPRLRDLHEYLLVFVKDDYSRPDQGESTFRHKEEFMAATLSVWDIPSESAKRVGHPAPFPVALADRVIRLFSYAGDVVLDPFNGSGTTCVSAVMNERHYVGYDIDEAYCQLADARIAEARASVATLTQHDDGVSDDGDG